MKLFRHIARIAFAAFTTAGVFSCMSPEVEQAATSGPSEMVFRVSRDEPATRGYVTGAALLDDESGSRPLYISAYHHAQSGGDYDYFLNQPFTRSDDRWHHVPPIYWPVEGRMDFLAYSSSVPFDESDIIWGANNCAERMRIRVGNDHTQDDILFGSSWGSTSSAGVPTSMTMYHCQAWIEVRCRLGSGVTSTGVLNSVALKNAYIDGVLNVQNNYGYPTMEWDFRGSEGRDRVLDDPDGIYDVPMTETGGTLKMLIPEQPMTSLLVSYTVNGKRKTSEIELPHANWIAGRHYIYEFDFSQVAVEPGSFGGFVIAPAPLSHNGTSFTIKDDDWNHDSYNTVSGTASGSYYFDYIELGRHFDAAGSTFDAYGGSIDNLGNKVTYAGYDSWRLGTESEWGVILSNSANVRPGSTVNGVPNMHYALVRLTGVTHAGDSTPAGILVFPDGNVILGRTLDGMDNTTVTADMTEAELNVYLNQSCAFLPCSGFYADGMWYYGGDVARYWMATEYNYANGYYASVTEDAVGRGNAAKTDQKYSVRLIREADATPLPEPEPGPVSGLTFTNTGSAESVTMSLTNSGSNAPSLEYSTDGSTWTEWDYSGLAITPGTSVYVRGNNPGGFSTSSSNYSTFSFSGSSTVSCTGDVMTLLDYDTPPTAIPCDYCFMSLFRDCTVLTTAPELPATTLTENCYDGMFYGCTSLTAGPELPATTLVSFCYRQMFRGCSALTSASTLPATSMELNCYQWMFYGCSSLTDAPELPATSLATGCYLGMFQGCSTLATAPALPATTLATNCYSAMFASCTSLTTAPVLPATTLASSCYNSMFNGCTSLTYIKAMFTTTPSTSYTKNWVTNVASGGTFVKNAAASWYVGGNNGIPNSWTVETASE